MVGGDLADGGRGTAVLWARNASVGAEPRNRRMKKIDTAESRRK